MKRKPTKPVAKAKAKPAAKGKKSAAAMSAQHLQTMVEEILGSDNAWLIQLAADQMAVVMTIHEKITEDAGVDEDESDVEDDDGEVEADEDEDFDEEDGEEAEEEDEDAEDGEEEEAEEEFEDEDEDASDEDSDDGEEEAEEEDEDGEAEDDEDGEADESDDPFEGWNSKKFLATFKEFGVNSKKVLAGLPSTASEAKKVKRLRAAAEMFDTTQEGFASKSLATLKKLAAAKKVKVDTGKVKAESKLVDMYATALAIAKVNASTFK